MPCSPMVFVGWTAVSAVVSAIVALMGIIVSTTKLESAVDCGIFGTKEQDSTTVNGVNDVLTYVGLPALISGILGVVGGSLGVVAGLKKMKGLACGAAFVLTIACICQFVTAAVALFLASVLNVVCDKFQCNATTGCTSFLAGIDGTCCHEDSIICQGDYDQICDFQITKTVLTAFAIMGFMLTSVGCGCGCGMGCCCPEKFSLVAQEKEKGNQPEGVVVGSPVAAAA